MIDLRSDTMTRPSPGMREAMARAEVGDEQYGEDPTVTALELRVAELLGHEAAVYLPTATMGNQIALGVLSRPGDELIVEEGAHVVVSELGGAARFSGLQLRMLRGDRGVLAPEQIRSAYRAGSFHTPPTGVLALENTHNTAGGAVWPLDALDAAVATARELGVAVHLDGARLLNAAVALGVRPARIAAQFDTVTLCLSKGLGCPMGALVAGSAELMVRARREKHAFGGALRQAGIVAAAGLYALDHNVERLADDHGAGLVAHAETNFVQVPVPDVRDAVERLAQAGVLLSPTKPGVLRAVTHLDLTDDDVERALELVPEALGARV
jgi:threonine aldolase